ncbi:hypothetical protein Cadr_000015242 [Camelus dromedarius]|uniref:Uncharacterized protein n=1 Tax=Camelus dromedarius TaxID=9838 RepID=A0A5N4DL76_CAMDR|nr:hypothetical protein Cadr_000015242 [Camelus dromedarius]
MRAWQILPCWPCPLSKLCDHWEPGLSLSGFNLKS